MRSAARCRSMLLSTRNYRTLHYCRVHLKDVEFLATEMDASTTEESRTQGAVHAASGDGRCSCWRRTRPLEDA